MALAVKSPVLFLMILAVIFDIIAVSIPYWFKIPSTKPIGIWRACSSAGCSGYILTSRGLHMFALICGIAALIFYILTELMELLDLKMRRMVTTVLSIVAGAFVLVADCFMATDIASLLHPACFSLSLMAAFCFIFVGGNLSSSVSSSD